MKQYKSKYEFTREELEEQKHEALKELIKINNDIKKEKKRKIITILIIFVVSFLLFKLFIGQIDINSPNIINQHKNRLYQISLNGEKITIGVEEVERKTIIPFIIYLKHYSSHSFFGNDSLNYKLGSKIVLDVKSFECYTKDDFQLSCVSDNGNLIKKEMTDLKYHLYIKRNSKGEKELYNGNLIRNLSDYLTEKGSYHISIVAKYKNVESTIYFDLKVE